MKRRTPVGDHRKADPSDQQYKREKKERSKRNSPFTDGPNRREIDRASRENKEHTDKNGVFGGRGPETRQVGNEERRINPHVKEACGEREPRFLSAPKRPKRAADPGVVPALLGDRGGEFRGHHRDGHCPNYGNNSENREATPETNLRNQLFKTVRPARNHQVHRRGEGADPEAARGGTCAFLNHHRQSFRAFLGLSRGTSSVCRAKRPFTMPSAVRGIFTPNRAGFRYFPARYGPTPTGSPRPLRR